MNDAKKLLELRNKIKRKKPFFIRQQTHKYKKLGKKWRRPKGIHSKLGAKLRGHRKSVSVGYKSPKAVRNFDKSGLEKRLVSSFKDLKEINIKKQGIIIAGSVGLKKKIEIVKEAQKKSIKILNLKDPLKFLEDSGEKLKKQKEEKQKIKQEKQKKLKKKEEKAKEKLKEEESKEKKKEEEPEDLAEKIEKEKKKEMDKVLTKKTI